MEFKKFKKVIETYLPKYIKKMKLEDWELTYNIYRDYKQAKLKTDIRADVEADFKYRTLNIRFFSKPHLDKKDALRTIQHELGHAYHAGFDYMLKLINIKFESQDSMELLAEIKSLAEETCACMVSNIDLDIK